MTVCNIAVLKGDGIGPEIVTECQKVLEKVCEQENVTINWEEAHIGGEAIDCFGSPYPEETLQICQAADAVLLGAVGGYKWETLPGEQRPEKGLLALRSSLNLYANLRPALVYKPLKAASPLRSDILGDRLDILVVRELTGGIYFGPRGKRVNAQGIEEAYDTEIYNKEEIRRIAKVAMQAALGRSGKIISVDKDNVLESSRLWRQTVKEEAEKVSGITVQNMYVDNAAMQLVRNPGQFDVLLTSNMFGDILSDLASMLTGSIGMLPSASLGEPGKPGVFEPIHGSAPDIAGKGIANPLATILSGAMLLRYTYQLEGAAKRIEKAVETVLENGYRTADLAEAGCNKIVGTVEMGNLVCAQLDA